MISSLDWSGTPATLRNYLIPDHTFFGFFPWAAFVAFGMSAGSILRLVRPEDIAPVMQWFGWGGLTLAFSAYTISNMSLSIYSVSDFWLNSPALVLIKVGAILIFIAFAWLWNMRTSAQNWSWVRQFGLTSLLVYWVHIELIYGRWFGMLKDQLTVGQTVFATVLTILAMLALSLLRTYWAQIRNYFTSSNAAFARRISGD
jgi:hypothetical protein